MLGIRGGFSAGVGNVALQVESFRVHHALLRTHSKRARGCLQHLHRVQRDGTRARPRRLLDLRHLDGGEGLRLLHKDEETLRVILQMFVHFLVKEVTARPRQGKHAFVLPNRQLDRPELLAVKGEESDNLALEVLDEVRTIHAEAKRGNLTRAVGDHVAVEVAVLVAEELGLETTEGDADLEVQLLTRFHCVRFVDVGIRERPHGLQNVGGSNC